MAPLSSPHGRHPGRPRTAPPAVTSREAGLALIHAHVQSIHDALALQAQLHIDPNAGTVAGTVTAGPAPLSAHHEHADRDGGQ
jgi:hypothetical protein